MDAIRIAGLTKQYKDVTAVDGLCLTVRQGELLSLLGVNGAGKTTTIKMLSCLTQPDGGDAYLNGKSIVRDAAAVKKIIGVSPQETAVAPGLTVEENLRLMCGVHGINKENAAVKIAELAEKLGLGFENMGITDLFQYGTADFSEAFEGPVFMTAANQAVRVEIDEQGVKAAAYIELPGAGAAQPPEEIIDFVLDRPFLFIISDSGIPLFAGTVNEP